MNRTLDNKVRTQKTSQFQDKTNENSGSKFLLFGSTFFWGKIKYYSEFDCDRLTLRGTPLNILGLHQNWRSGVYFRPALHNYHYLLIYNHAENLGRFWHLEVFLHCQFLEKEWGSIYTIRKDIGIQNTYLSRWFSLSEGGNFPLRYVLKVENQSWHSHVKYFIK